MKPRATLLALFALVFLALDASAQSRTGARRGKKPQETSIYGGYARTKMLKAVRNAEGTAQLGSAARRALLTTGRLPAFCTKPKRGARR